MVLGINSSVYSAWCLFEAGCNNNKMYICMIIILTRGELFSHLFTFLCLETLCLMGKIRCCSGIIGDLQRRLPYYVSDWTDIWTPKIISSTLFIFFTSIAPAITFSLYISESTDNELGVIEILLAMALTGILFSVLAGQPLVILGVTGPVAILTASLYTISKALGLKFIPFYAWSQLWAAFFHILLACTNACHLVTVVTRFSCETFGVLIALIYIYTGLEGIAKFFVDDYTFQVALLQFIIAIGTAYTSTYLSHARHWHVLNEHFRNFMADYGATLSVAAWSFLPYICTSRLASDVYDTYSGREDNHMPKLFMPLSFTTTSGRAWFVDFTDIPVYGVFLAIFSGTELECVCCLRMVQLKCMCMDLYGFCTVCV